MKINELIAEEKQFVKDAGIKKRSRNLSKKLRFMKIQTLNVPESWIEEMNKLVSKQRFANRSELMRSAIKDLLERELVLESLRRRRVD